MKLYDEWNGRMLIVLFRHWAYGLLSFRSARINVVELLGGQVMLSAKTWLHCGISILMGVSMAAWWICS